MEYTQQLRENMAVRRHCAAEAARVRRAEAVILRHKLRSGSLTVREMERIAREFEVRRMQ